MLTVFLISLALLPFPCFFLKYALQWHVHILYKALGFIHLIKEPTPSQSLCKTKGHICRLGLNVSRNFLIWSPCRIRQLIDGSQLHLPISNCSLASPSGNTTSQFFCIKSIKMLAAPIELSTVVSEEGQKNARKITVKCFKKTEL